MLVLLEEAFSKKLLQSCRIVPTCRRHDQCLEWSTVRYWM